MSKFELGAYTIGDAPQYLADEGVELAKKYFDEQDIDMLVCFEAYERDQNSDLGRHWLAAEREANRVLAGDGRYDNSMVVLEAVELES
ncbi:hypothetical protein [Photobacterium rosenbergii]|uniref:Uncharacterized protein n=1 Tax=Photobacterium rosenbergii TaxID=294936 RepID=A0ABU3ZLZ0_9GAMM|nr:hypothetical protein [Photobacterium rosenbergii]MDV5170978.1 hypothetical protein [Photobacterium rosenbergii]